MAETSGNLGVTERDEGRGEIYFNMKIFETRG